MLMVMLMLTLCTPRRREKALERGDRDEADRLLTRMETLQYRKQRQQEAVERVASVSTALNRRNKEANTQLDNEAGIRRRLEEQHLQKLAEQNGGVVPLDPFARHDDDDGRCVMMVTVMVMSADVRRGLRFCGTRVTLLLRLLLPLLPMVLQPLPETVTLRAERSRLSLMVTLS